MVSNDDNEDGGDVDYVDNGTTMVRINVMVMIMVMMMVMMMMMMVMVMVMVMMMMVPAVTWRYLSCRAAGDSLRT